MRMGAGTLLMLVVGGLAACGRGSTGRDDREAGEAPVSAPSRLQDVAGRAFVVLDSADERRLGLVVAPLTTRSATPQVTLTGEVVPDSSRTTVVRAALAGRVSVPDGAHWPAFGETVRAGQVVGQVSDARPLAVAHGGAVTRVAAHPGELVEAGQPLLEVTDFAFPLVRVTWSSDAPPAPPSRIRVGAIDRAGPQYTAVLHGPALEADPFTRLPAWLYRVSEPWPAARPGLPVAAVVALPGTSSKAAFIPNAAVVQWDGLTWAFRREGDRRYARVRLGEAEPVAGGWLASPGGELAAGDTVVVRGAQVLLSEEFKSRVRVGDEVSE